MACFLVAAICVVLAACSSSDKKEPEINVMPTHFKQEVLLVFPNIVADPTNTRDAAISDPVLDPNGPVKVYYVCVRANPRNAALQYTGIKTYAGYFYTGHLGQFVEAPPGLCETAVYKPFPELEKLCLGKTCK